MEKTIVKESKTKPLNIHLKEIEKESTKKTTKYKYKCDSFSDATFQLVKIEHRIPDLFRSLRIFKNWK